MVRKIIKIDEDKCNGCGLCAKACHEGAIGMVAGKAGGKVAALLRDDYCDGLGDCLPACPTGAITFEEREAAAYDEAAVRARIAEAGFAATGRKTAEPDASRAAPRRVSDEAAAGGRAAGEASMAAKNPPTMACGCPGTHARALNRPAAADAPAQPAAEPASQLAQWPVQIKLAPVNAPYFDGAKLLIAADCTAYAYAGFHQRFMKNHLTLIGCPKLDAGDYAEKLTEILRQNDIKSVTVARMEVPCCGGIENAVKTALANSGKMIPWQVVTLSTDGQLLDDGI